MLKPYQWLIVITSLAAASQFSNASAQTQRDPGASGIVDGSDIYQFLNSGPIIDPTRMEEASIRADKVIKMPSRHQTKSWQEVIDRDQDLENQAEVVRFKGDLGQSRGSTGTVNTTGITQGTNTQKPHHTFMQKLENGFIRASEAVGFPISDEPLPGDVDSSLAGDLPAGQDPRIYVHEEKRQAQAPVPLKESAPPTVMME